MSLFPFLGDLRPDEMRIAKRISDVLRHSHQDSNKDPQLPTIFDHRTLHLKVKRRTKKPHSWRKPSPCGLYLVDYLVNSQPLGHSSQVVSVDL